jgi:hypothetical protein
MAKTTTTATGASVTDFINSFATTEQKRKDSFELVQLMEEVSGYKAYMWGPSIIGFGSYHYKYASGHEGDAPRIGFSPRKTALTLYVHNDEYEEIVTEKLGKFTMSKGCIYVKKLADIDLNELKKLIQYTLKWMDKKYGSQL